MSDHTGLELAIRESRVVYRLLTDHFKQFFVKFADQNFLSVRIFVLKETKKFLFTLQALHFAFILLQKLFNCTLFSYIWIAFWSPNLQWGSLERFPIHPSCWKYSLIFRGSVMKGYFEP